MSPAISVIIPTYKRPELLQRALKALGTQTLKRDLFEVIICDDEPSKETKAVVSRACLNSDINVRYLEVTGPHGPAAARNQGAKIARGGILAFTDDDCIPLKPWLENALLFFKTTSAVALTGKVVVPRSHIPSDYEKNEAGLEKAEFVSANLFIWRDSFLKVGGFHEGFKTAWREDSELHFKLLKCGYKIERACEAIVHHPVRPASFGVSIRQQQKSRYDALLFKLHPELYISKIGPFAPRLYYLFALGVILIIISPLNSDLLTPGIALAWASWLLFTLQRLKGTSKHPRHIFEMALTSALLPLLSLYWRIRGGYEQRVLFI